jgi:hypothetical protein
MHRIEDKVTAKKNIQRYLSKIYEGELPVYPSGIFDKNTITALNRFQKDNGLDIVNYLDYESFSKLYKKYLIKIDEEKILKESAFGTAYPLSRGDQGAEIGRINIMLSDILTFYGQLDRINTDDYFSQSTEDAVKIISEIFDIDEVTDINETLYSRIKKEWNSIQGLEYFP